MKLPSSLYRSRTSARRARWEGALACLALASLRAAPPAQASIMIALELPDLVKMADHIAVVDVRSVESAWDDKHERIYSTIRLDVVDSWKAPAAAGGAEKPSAITVVQPGGTVGDMSMVVMGMGTFVPGARALVFLRGTSAHAQVVGMTQGVHPLAFEATANRWTVAPAALSQVKLVRPSRAEIATATATARAGAPSKLDLSSRVPLDSMKSEVLRLMGATP